MSSIASTFRDFFKSRFNTYIVIALVLLGSFAYFLTGTPTEATPEQGVVVHFFFLPTCPHCAEQKPIITELAAERPDIQFIWHDASSQEGSALFYKMSTEAGLDTSKLAVPTLFINDHTLVGVHTKEQISEVITECLNECKGTAEKNATTQEVETSFTDYELPIIGRTDLTQYSLPVLTILLGLIDGFNPCAMWVLVYLIGVLIELNDRKKVWIIVGSFVLASGLLYFLFMTAWINIFLLVGYIRLLTLIIGLVAIGGGIINLKEYFTAKEALACKVGDDKSHEKTIGRIDHIVSQPISLAIIISIIALAFVVNSVEFVCSAAIPAVYTQLLAMKGLTALQNYAYIALYVFFFMFDDLIIFGMAAFAISSRFGQRYAKYSKLVGGIIMTVLGLAMVFAPQLLR
jgi:thiol-disulfide isomerase/thioredoxin